MNCLVIVGLFLLAMIIFEALLLINKDEECNECDYKFEDYGYIRVGNYKVTFNAKEEIEKNQEKEKARE